MTQPDIEVALQFEIAQSGKPYTTQRPIKEYADGYDCSALQVAGLRHMSDEAGVQSVVPPNVSNTVDLYNWGKSIGGLVSVTKGIATRGAIFIKGRWWGYGPLGHTSMSCGDGTAMAAHGTHSNPEIGIAPLYGGREYQDALIIPGVFYAALQPPVDPAVIKELGELAAWGKRVTAKPLVWKESGTDVTTLNKLLIAQAMMPSKGVPMNIYSKQTVAGVNHFKRAHKLPNTDGKVFGGIAATAILT